MVGGDIRRWNFRGNFLLWEMVSEIKYDLHIFPLNGMILMSVAKIAVSGKGNRRLWVDLAKIEVKIEIEIGNFWGEVYKW